MEVKPKFNVGDTPVTMIACNIVKIKIDNIKFDGMFSDEWNEVNVRYHTAKGSEFLEEELFSSKEELMEYLSKQSVVVEES